VHGWRGTVALSLVVAGVAAPAWAGGQLQTATRSSSIGSFRAAASTIAHSLAGGPVEITCAGGARWRSLAAQWGFDPATTWAMTPRHWDSSAGRAVADGRAEFSPRACRFGAAFRARPTEVGARLCRHGSLIGECDDWALTLRSVHVLAHESMHLAGALDEAQADCYAVQLDALVARALGAEPRFARRLAREYWTFYYPSQDRAYRSSDCHDGGPLDLFPERAGWPSPNAYPANVAVRVGRLAAPGT
jgi:hypothetical protein